MLETHDISMLEYIEWVSNCFGLKIDLVNKFHGFTIKTVETTYNNGSKLKFTFFKNLDNVKLTDRKEFTNYFSTNLDYLYQYVEYKYSLLGNQKCDKNYLGEICGLQQGVIDNCYNRAQLLYINSYIIHLIESFNSSLIKVKVLADVEYHFLH